MAGDVVCADEYGPLSFREAYESQNPGTPNARIRILRRVQNPVFSTVPIFRAEVLENLGSAAPLWKEIDFLIWDTMGAQTLAAKFTPGSEWITRFMLVHVEGQPVNGLTGYLLGVSDHPGSLLSVKDGKVTGNILKEGYFPGPGNSDHPDPPESMKLEEFQKLMATWKKKEKEAAPAR